MIIGLGYKARSGKDTAASYLVNNYGFVQESFAEPLKEHIGRAICGLNEKQLYGAWKERIDPDWGMTPRQMLQLIGTDALRNVVHKDFWVVPMRRKLREHYRNGRHVVISDCRMLNEVELVKEWSGLVVRIDRENADKISGIEKHASEIELEGYVGWNYVLDNNSNDGYDELYAGMDTLLTDAGWVR